MTATWNRSVNELRKGYLVCDARQVIVKPALLGGNGFRIPDEMQFPFWNLHVQLHVNSKSLLRVIDSSSLESDGPRSNIRKVRASMRLKIPHVY